MAASTVSAAFSSPSTPAPAALDLQHDAGELRRRVGDQRRHGSRHASRYRGREGQSEERRSLQDARRRRVAEPGHRPRAQHDLFRRRQSVTGSRRRAAPGRQPVHGLAGRGGPQYRRLQVPLSVHRPRRMGSGRRKPGHPRGRQRPERQRRPGACSRRQVRSRLRQRPPHLQAHPLLGGDGAAGEHVGAADRKARACCPAPTAAWSGRRSR